MFAGTGEVRWLLDAVPCALNDAGWMPLADRFLFESASADEVELSVDWWPEGFVEQEERWRPEPADGWPARWRPDDDEALLGLIGSDLDLYLGLARVDDGRSVAWTGPLEVGRGDHDTPPSRSAYGALALLGLLLLAGRAPRGRRTARRSTTLGAPRGTHAHRRHRTRYR